MKADTLLLDAGVWVATIDSEDAFVSASRELVFGPTGPLAALDLTKLRMSLARGFDRDGLENAITYRLTACDAAYVAVARRFDWQLVSTDLRDLVSKGLAITPDAAV